jgi:putative hydrolase of HD superfamily
MKFWEEETRDSDYAIRVEPAPRLESVADHSWHLADMALFLCRRFPDLDVARVLGLAVLHDKPEIITDDSAPMGRDGTGEKTYAFSEAKREQRQQSEYSALERYLCRLPPGDRELQRSLLQDAIAVLSPEARFVKALDKIQALTFVLRKKAGNLTAAHLRFSLRYAREGCTYFPGLEPYYSELSRRLIKGVNRHPKLTHHRRPILTHPA